jgi:hypothetical protein
MNMNLRVLASVLGMAALVSCASYDPALVDRIEEVWDQPAGEAVYENGDPQSWQVGQWVRLRVDDNGTRGFRTVLVAKEEGTAYWIDIHDVWPDRERRAALLVDGYRPGDTASTKILRIQLQRANGEIVDLEADSEEAVEARDIRAKIGFLLDLIELRHTSGRIEEVAVPAGTFQDAVEKSFVVTAGGEKWMGSIWYTNAVPVTGWARVEARSPYLVLLTWKRSLQVVAFGETGVASAFFD